MMTAEFLLQINRRGPSKYYALCKRRKFLWWRYWECFATTQHLPLAKHYMEEAGMTKENTQVERLDAP